MSATEEKPVRRKFPAPCWTQGETLVLIEAYRERWYALRRGYLRTKDWEAVTAEVTRRCPGASPSKISAQCRHKMEKLRQRYRAEKQRAFSFPGPFFSSWLYFDYMNSMENGSDLPVKLNREADDQGNSRGESRTNALVDHSLTTLKLNSKKFRRTNEEINGDVVSDSRSVDQNLISLGYKARNFSKSGGNSCSSFGSSYLEIGLDKDAEGIGCGAGFPVNNPINVNLPPPGYKSKKPMKILGNWIPNFGTDYDGDGFPVPIDRNSGFKVNKLAGIDGKLNDIPCCEADGNEGLWINMPNDKNSAPPGFRTKWSGKSNANFNPYVDSNRVVKGFSSSMRSGFGKSRGGGGGGTKRGRNPVEEMVSSIKLLGEGFMNMEKVKMEMTREREQMRMETELRRNELLLESQKQIVEAFMKGLSESNKQKKTMVSQDP